MATKCIFIITAFSPTRTPLLQMTMLLRFSGESKGKQGNDFPNTGPEEILSPANYMYPPFVDPAV